MKIYSALHCVKCSNYTITMNTFKNPDSITNNIFIKLLYFGKICFNFAHQDYRKVLKRNTNSV